MLRLTFLGLAAAAAGTIAFSMFQQARAEDPKLPANPMEAVAQAKPWVEAAVKAKQAETPELVKGVRRAVDVLQTQLRAAKDDDAYAALWNEALTVTRFHGNAPTGAYSMASKEAVDGWILFGLPTGRGWTWSEGRPAGSSQQLWGSIIQTTSDGRVAACVRIYVYQFNYDYNGLSGDNAKGIAEACFADDKAGMTSVESRSTRPVAKPLSRSFNRAHYYEITGIDDKKLPVRKRHFFAKGSTRTYHVEVLEFRDVRDDDTPFLKWLKGVANPELEAVLDSFEEGDPTNKKKKK